MRRYLLSSMIIITLMMAISVLPVFSQETGSPEAKPDGAVEPNELSIYGEVQSADAASNLIVVQYYDYDSDEEKIINVTVNKDTKLENAASLAEMKKGDWVDVEYAVSDGKNIGKIVTVEKEEEMVGETMNGPSQAELPEEE